jgi:hypothetical protein
MLQWLLVDVQRQGQHVQWWSQADTEANPHSGAITVTVTISISFWLVRNQRSNEKI